MSQSRQSTQRPGKLSEGVKSPTVSDKEYRERSTKSSAHDPDAEHGHSQQFLSSDEYVPTDSRTTVRSPESKIKSDSKISRKSSEREFASRLDLSQAQSRHSLLQSEKRSLNGSRESVGQFVDHSNRSLVGPERRRQTNVGEHGASSDGKTDSQRNVSDGDYVGVPDHVSDRRRQTSGGENDPMSDHISDRRGKSSDGDHDAMSDRSSDRRRKSKDGEWDATPDLSSERRRKASDGTYNGLHDNSSDRRRSTRPTEYNATLDRTNHGRRKTGDDEYEGTLDLSSERRRKASNGTYHGMQDHSSDRRRSSRDGEYDVVTGIRTSNMSYDAQNGGRQRDSISHSDKPFNFDGKQSMSSQRRESIEEGRRSGKTISRDGSLDSVSGRTGRQRDSISRAETPFDYDGKQSSGSQRRATFEGSIRSGIAKLRDGSLESPSGRQSRQRDSILQSDIQFEGKPSLFSQRRDTIEGSRRPSNTKSRDVSRESIPCNSASFRKECRGTDLSGRSMSSREDSRIVASQDGDIPYTEGNKDVCSVGDSVKDVSITLKCDPGAKTKSPSSNCIQLCASMQSPGNIVVLNVLDCGHACCAPEQIGSTDNESQITKKDEIASIAKCASSLRQTEDFDRIQSKQRGRDCHLSNTMERCSTPCDFLSRGYRSDICKSPLSVRQPCHQSACDLSPTYPRLYQCNGTAKDLSLGGRYSYRRSNTGLVARAFDINKFNMDNRKSSHFSSRYKRDDYGTYNSFDDEEFNQSKSFEPRDSRRSITHIDDSLNVRTPERTDDTSDYDTQNDTPGHQLSYGAQDVESRNTNVSVDSSLQHKRPRKDGSSLSTLSGHEQSGGWYSRKVEDRATSVSSSKRSSSENSECSSTKIEVNSCIDDVAMRTGQRSRKFKEKSYCDETRTTQSGMESPLASTKRQSSGFRGRSDSRQSLKGLNDEESVSRKSKEGSKLSSHLKEQPFTESLYDPSFEVQSGSIGGTGSDSKHRARHRYCQKQRDCSCDDDNEGYISREDVSTSISRQIPTEMLDDNVQKLSNTSMGSHSRRSREIRMSNQHDEECGETPSIKSIKGKNHLSRVYNEMNDTQSHSERLSYRSASFKCEAGKNIKSRDTSASWNDKPQIHLMPYPSVDVEFKGLDEICANAASRSSHSVVSKDSAANGRGHLLREAQHATRRIRKEDCRTAGQMRRKLYPNPATQLSHSTSAANSTSDVSHDEENSENTLPASPGELESEYMDDDESEGRTKSGKIFSHQKSCVETDLRKLQRRIPSRRSESQDESHNSSSCRSTPKGIQDGTSKGSTRLKDSGKTNRNLENLNPNSESLLAQNTANEERPDPRCENFTSNRFNMTSSKARNKRREPCEKRNICHDQNKNIVSSELGNNRQIDKHPSQVQPIATRTRSPRFHHVKSPVVNMGDEDYHEDDQRLIGNTRSRSNSASHGHRSRVYREGTIDTFQQIITPEQPLQIHESRYMHSIKDGVPFYCKSLEATFKKPTQTRNPASQVASPVFKDSERVHVSVDDRCIQERTQPSIKESTEIIKESPTRSTRAAFFGRYPFMRLRNMLLQSGDENLRIPSSGRKSRTRSASGMLRPPLNNTHRAKMDFTERTFASSSPEFQETHFGFRERHLKSRPLSDHSFDDTDYSDGVVSWSGNKNFSSSAEIDRNSSSGNGDSWYPEYAYRCGVIDTLRLLDNDLPMSTPSADVVCPSQNNESSSESCSIRHQEIEDHLSYIVKSIPPVGKQGDEAFELIRENSLKALFYAEKLSLDWPFLKLYDSQAGSLETWSRDVMDYSSTSNVSSLLDVCRMDAKTSVQDLKSLNPNRGCSKGQNNIEKVKYSVAYETPVVSKPNFSDGDRRRHMLSSVSTDDALSEDNASTNTEQLQSDKSESAVENIATKSEQSQAATERSDATQNESGAESCSEAEEQYEPESSPEVTGSEENTTSEVAVQTVDKIRSRSCTQQENTTVAPNNRRKSFVEGRGQEGNLSLNKVDACTMTLHRATLSLVEENRLRDAVSRKLGFSQNFTLVPVAFSKSVSSTDTHSGLTNTAECNAKVSQHGVQKSGSANPHNEVLTNKADIFDDICKKRLESKEKMMTFYVIALEKPAEEHEGIGKAQNSAELKGHEPSACTCSSDTDGKSKKYFIYTRDELIKAVAKLDNHGGSGSTLPTSQRQQNQPQRERSCVSESVAHNSAADKVNKQTKQTTNSGRNSRQRQISDLKSGSAVEQISSGKDRAASVYLHEDTPAKILVEKEHQKGTDSSTLLCQRTRSTKVHEANSNTQHRSGEIDIRSETMTAKLANHCKESFSRPVSANESKTKQHISDTVRSFVNNHSSSSEETTCFCSQHLLSNQAKTSSCERETGRKKLQLDAGKDALERGSKYSCLRQTHSEHLSTNEWSRVGKSEDEPKKLSVSLNEKLGHKLNRTTSYAATDGKEFATINNLSKLNNNKNTLKTAQMNSSSSSEVVSNHSKARYRSKSSSDIDWELKIPGSGNIQIKQGKGNNSSEFTNLSLLESLVDGKLKVCLNKALDKWKSPKRKICFRLSGENAINENKTKDERYRYVPSCVKRYCNSSLSSDEYQYSSSQSASSATDTMTDKSLTEESAVIMSLPINANSINRRKMSVELTQLQNDKLLDWINNSVPEPLKSKSKQGRQPEKYVLSIKRKSLLSEIRGRRGKRSRSRKGTQSSDSGNITNSANDCYDQESRNCCSLITPRPGSDWTLTDYKRRPNKFGSLEHDFNRSPVKQMLTASSLSRPRCGFRKPNTRTDTRRVKPRKTMSVPRRRRSKKRTTSMSRRSRTKRRSRQKVSSPIKSPIMVPESKRKEASFRNPLEVNSVAKTNVKSFSTSGISRIARALNGFSKTGSDDIVLNEDVQFERHHGKHFRPETVEDKRQECLKNLAQCKEKSRVCDADDDDSLADCEALDSYLLTPIKEETHSQATTCSDVSKSDFESFVDKCRMKLIGITEDFPSCQNESRIATQHISATNSCPSSSFQRSTASSGNHCSRNDSDTSDNQKNSFVRRREGCCDLLRDDLTDDVRRANAHCREYFFSYLQYINPFKSAFLRSEMHGMMNGSTRRNDEQLCKNEDELLKLYANGSNKSNFFSTRTKPLPTWPMNRRDMNRSWRQTDSDRQLLSEQVPGFTRSVPDVKCTLTQNTSSPFRCNYMSTYLSKWSPQINAYVDNTTHNQVKTYREESRNTKGVANRWYSADYVDFGTSYHDLIRRNWNESANNGSDESSSGDSSGNDELEMRDSDLRGDYVRAGQLKSKIQAGDAPTSSNERPENIKPSREPRIGHMPQEQYFKESQHVPLDDPHYMCHEHACMSYDYVHQNYQVARVSNFAARNINGSGNMFGRGMHPGDERMSVMQEHERDSDDEFTSATEDFPHYSSGCKKRPKHCRKSSQEIDDTCNHPDSMSYYMGDGPSGQFDNFEGIPKEDLLINLSPVDDDGHLMYCPQRQKNIVDQRSSSEAAGQSSASLNKAGRNECELHGPIGVAHQMEKNHVLAGRSCFGQGDIVNKRTYTQWYVDEADKGQLAQRRLTASVAPGEKCSHREIWITPSENCDSSVDEAEEGDDDDDNDCEDEDEEENDEEEEDGEEVDDDDEEEEDDDDNEDDDEDEDVNRAKLVMNSNEDHHGVQLQPKPCCLDHLKETNAQNNYQHQNCQDMNESKMMGKRAIDVDSLSKRPSRARTIMQSKRYTAGNKQGHQQSTGDHLTKHKQPVAHDKNAQIKTAGAHQHKFSLEQIKVPAIEKERVRFACDENGDWAEIGRGSYGCVYLGLLDGIVEVAIKDFYESSSWDLVIHEARMLMFLQDTGITPKFYGLRRRFDISKQPSEYCIIMEYFGDGRTLFNVMSDKMVLGGDEWMDIVGQLVAGLRLIHRKNVLINDLKADNILIDLTGGRKIIRYIDVGMATYKQGLTFQLPQDQMSKYNFLAPEVREGARTTTRSDIYSLGYMLEQMCRMADAALGGLKKLVTRCMEKNPARRPDIDDIVSQVHRFIASKASLMINSSSPREQFVLTNSV